MEVHNCEECSYKTKLLFGMIYHVRRHRSNPHGELFSCEKPPVVYSCPHCYFETDLSIVLKEHTIALHKNEESEEVEDYNFRTFECETCKFQTFSILLMLKHVTNGCAETEEPSSSLQRKRLECGQYPSATFYKYKNSLRLLEIEWFQCAQCPYKTMYKTAIRKHVYRKHVYVKQGDLSDIKWLNCDKCSYKGNCKSNLKSHVIRMHEQKIRMHEQKLGFPCGQCSFVASEKSNLKIHIIRKHTNPEDIKWLECDRCDLKFKTTDSLRYHMMKKHEIEWHHCTQCPFKTKDNIYLRKHTFRKHGGTIEVKWFECDQCNRKFKSKKGLQQHVDRIHYLERKETAMSVHCQK